MAHDPASWAVLPQLSTIAHNCGMRVLPPFAELVAFEAVARHLSVTRAAEELCITQSAVSHRIRRLEQHFGTSLVRRLPRGLALTPAGHELLPRLVVALDSLTGLGRSDMRRLRVAAGSGLCNWWLAGRLSDFMKRCPGISVELVALDSIHSPIPDADVRILWVPAAEDGIRLRQAPLFVEWVFPVCSPRVLPGGAPLGDPRELAGMTLLHKATDAAGEWSWSIWLQRMKVPANSHSAGQLSFADMGLLMSATVDGAGVALTRSLLAHDALAATRLIPAVAGVVPMKSTKMHVARWPSSRDHDPAVIAFVEWLAQEAQATLASTAKFLQCPDVAVK